MKKAYQYFFYDFDGMIADTYPHIAHAFATVLSEMRGVSIDEQQTFDLLKISFKEAYGFYQVTEEEKARIKERHEDMDFPPFPTLFPHVKEVLQESLDKGCKNFIYTNRGESVHTYLKSFGIHDYFTDFILHADKPNPNTLNKIIGQYGLPLADCVVVGDRSIDVNAAAEAGVDGILFDLDDRVSDHRATHVIRSIDELFVFL